MRVLLDPSQLRQPAGRRCCCTNLICFARSLPGHAATVFGRTLAHLCNLSCRSKGGTRVCATKHPALANTKLRDPNEDRWPKCLVDVRMNALVSTLHALDQHMEDMGVNDCCCSTNLLSAWRWIISSRFGQTPKQCGVWCFRLISHAVSMQALPD